MEKLSRIRLVSRIREERDERRFIILVIICKVRSLRQVGFISRIVLPGTVSGGKRVTDCQTAETLTRFKALLLNSVNRSYESLSKEGEMELETMGYDALDTEIADKRYDGWRFKTFAYIKEKGWGYLFEDASRMIPSEEAMLTEEVSKEDSKMHRCNMEVYDELVMACEGIPLNLVRRAKGNARKAFELLDKKYSHNLEENLGEVLTEFSRCKLATNEDPDTWFMELDRLNNRLRAIDSKYEKREVELWVHLVGGLPKGYEEVMTKLNGKMKDYDVVGIKEEIRNKWRREFKPREEEKDVNGKKGNPALNGEENDNKRKGSTEKDFEGLCRYGDKQGHNAIECRSKEKMCCYKCGKEEHLLCDCSEKKDKESKKELFVGMCFVRDESETEEVVGSVSNKEKFLLDSGATCHIVASESMLSDIKSVKESLIIGNGNKVPIVKSGTLTLSTESGVMLLSDVKVAPKLAKNTISTVLLEKKGNKIEMSNGVMTVTDRTGKNSIKIAKNKETLYFLRATVVETRGEALAEWHANGPVAKEMQVCSVHCTMKAHDDQIGEDTTISIAESDADKIKDHIIGEDISDHGFAVPPVAGRKDIGWEPGSEKSAPVMTAEQVNYKEEWDAEVIKAEVALPEDGVKEETCLEWPYYGMVESGLITEREVCESVMLGNTVKYYKVRKKVMADDWKTLGQGLKKEKTLGYFAHRWLKYYKVRKKVMADDWKTLGQGLKKEKTLGYFAMSLVKKNKERCALMKCLMGYLDSTDVHVKLIKPLELTVYVWMDSSDWYVVFLKKNAVVGMRTKHSNVRIHHIQERLKRNGGDKAKKMVRVTRLAKYPADNATKDVTDEMQDMLVPGERKPKGSVHELIFASDREDVSE